MGTRKSRLAKLTTSLTPTQAVVHWMAEAHEYPTLVDHACALAARPQPVFPLNYLPEQVEQAVRQAMRGEDQERVDRVVREAVRDCCFLYHLHQRANMRVLEAQDALVLRLLRLGDGLIDLLDRESARNRLATVRMELEQHLPYPLDPDSAAAVQAATAGYVETWAMLDDGETVAEWVAAAYEDEGKTALPSGAYLARDGANDKRPSLYPVPEPDELRALFSDEASYAAFLAGTDYTTGFSDVTDAEATARCATVAAALRRLIDDGAVQAGTVVRLATVPFAFLGEAPLVDGVWLDRTVAALAEWGALAARRGFALVDAADDSPFACGSFRHSDDDQADARAAAALHADAGRLLGRFPGRTREIEGRPYLHAADYDGWKGRKVKGKLLASTEHGFLARSWNAWVAAHGGSGTARLADVPVESIACYAEGYPFVVCEGADLATRRAGRTQVFAALRPDVLPDDTDNDGPSTARSFPALARAWHRQAMDLLVEVFVHRGFVEALSQRYFHGASVLFPASAELLAVASEAVEQAVTIFNDAIAAPLDRYPAASGAGTAIVAVDPSAIPSGCAATIAVSVRGSVDLAKADALDDMGERRAAHELILQTLRPPPGSA
jgi:hypothetical protein